MAQGPTHEAERASWKWIGLIGVLAFTAIFLNAGLFVLVQQHERGISDRELETQRRLVAVEAKEARLASLNTEISALEEHRTKVQRRTEEAEKIAADATRVQAERDRAVSQLRAAEADIGKRAAEAESLRAQVATLKSDESFLRKTISARTDELANLEKTRDGLFTTIKAFDEQKLLAARDAESARKNALDISKLKADRDSIYREWQDRTAELARVQVQLEAAKASRNAIIADETAAKRADALRAEAEGTYAKAQEEVRAAQQQLLQIKNELAHFEQLRKSAAIDEAAAQRANTLRVDAERALAKIRDDVSGADKTLMSTRAEIAQLERQRANIISDDAAARRAESARKEAELALTKAQAELSSVQQNVTEVHGELMRLRRLKGLIDADDETAKRAEAARKDAERRLAEAKRDLDDLSKQITAATKQRDSLNAEIENLRNAHPAAAEPPPGPITQSPTSRRSEGIPATGPARNNPSTARPQARPPTNLAPRTSTVP